MESSPTHSDDQGKYKKRWLNGARPAIFGAVGFLIVTLPFFASAGLNKGEMKAFALDLLQKAQVSGENRESKGENSQTLSLLMPVSRPNPENARGGGDIAIVEGSALLPESGPMGTAADLDGAASSGAISLYVVRKGDTVGEIARMYGVSVNTIRWANDLGAGALKEGQTLLILPVSGVRHVVKASDTIEKIAKEYSADATEIAIFNDIPLRAGSLTVGDIVIVPNGEQTLTPSTTEHRGARISSHAGVGLRSLAGYYRDPLPGHIKTQGLHGWNGVDLSAYYGAPVLAAAKGIVIVSRQGGWNGGYGNYIVIAHDNGTQTLYGHLASTVVSAGTTVDQGDEIGTEGNSGRSTGPHLHFEVRGAKNPF